MNIRSLTRGDGVVIGAAVLLFIASFLDLTSSGVDECVGRYCPPKMANPNAWDSLSILMTIYLSGVIAAALIVVSRALPQQRRIAGIDVGQFGVAFAFFAAWSAFWTIIQATGASAGLILGLIAALILAGAAIATPLVPALKVGLVGAPRPQAPSPYGGGPTPGGYGYPGAQQPGQGYGYPGGSAQPGQGGQPGPQSYGGQAGATADASGGTSGGAGQQAATPAAGGGAEFAPFWFAVPVARPLYGEDGSPAPIAELAPGTWYLAVEQRGQALIAQTQDGRRGVLQDTTGIQRG
ncbi:DUF5336 domain-containing protein [Streptomyces sp. MST-110588]|uniref:DUF5336 domain-containing protein n=1 Tax=Streptomyces sp. MST-110588 TaxID=2833628 RepID=UPI001F5CC686|nr:DUF5336 domain-containing protein [Streptomyces sp. MST-110588]UNO42355.1 hypothetical protein KGS77_26060 [Streptomyces sp. MST-110588]